MVDNKQKNETLKKKILNSELMKEVLSIRLESLWAMINQSKKLGYMPGADQEGATSRYDNEGAMFMPGGYVVHNSSRRKPERHPYESKDPESFRSLVRGIMGDNATLLYQDGYSKSQNLNNTLYSDIAVHIMSLNRSLNTKNDAIDPKKPPRRITPEQIAKSYSPLWVNRPYGARTLLGACIAAASTKPKGFFEMLRLTYNFDNDDEEELLDNYVNSRQPILADDGKTVLAKPHIVVCHTQRHRADTMTGITKVMGYSRNFGEFSTITIDRVTDRLMKRIYGRTVPRDHEILAEYAGKKYVGVITSYPSSNVGVGRQSPMKSSLISPTRDLGMNIDELTEFYREKYKL